VTKKPVSQGRPAQFFPGQAGAEVQFRNWDLVRANPFTDLAVITILEPISGNGLLPTAKALGVGTGQLGSRKEPGSLEDRAEGGADGTFDAVVDIRFHLFLNHRGQGEHRG